jgi:methionine salvage enolase-phosphatase E1
MNYPLRAADAFQLAAAWTWTSGEPQGYVFISGDAQLLKAARQVGFQVVAV